MSGLDGGYEVDYGTLGFALIALAAIGVFFTMGINATAGDEDKDDFLK